MLVDPPALITPYPTVLQPACQHCGDGDLAPPGARRAGQRFHFDVAVVTLDLAFIAFEQGDTAAVKRMAEEASILLTRAEAKQEAFAALSLLLRAVDAETLTLATLEQVRGRLAKVTPA